MTRPLRALARRLAGPTGRRLLTLTALAGLWAWWLWGPVTPLASWAIPGPPADYGQSSWLAGGGRFVVHATYKTPPTNLGPVNEERLGPIAVRDLPTGREILSLFADDPGGSLGFVGPDGSSVAVYDGQRTLRILATADGQELAAFPALADNGNSYLWRAVPSPDGRMLALAPPSPHPNSTGAIHLWDVTTGRERAVLPRAVYAYGSWAAPAFSPDGRVLVTQTPEQPSAPAVAAPSLSGTTLKVWDVPTGRELAAVTVPGIGHAPTFSANGRQLAWTTRTEKREECQVQVWDWTADAAPVTVATFAKWDQGELGFVADGRHVYVNCQGKTHVWDWTARPPDGGRQIPAEVFEGWDRHFSKWQSSTRHGRTLSYRVPTLEICPAGDESRRVACRLRHAESYLPFELSADGTTLAVTCVYAPPMQPVLRWLNVQLGLPVDASDRRMIQVFDAATGAERVTMSLPVASRVFGFSPDGQMLWTGTMVEGSSSGRMYEELRFQGWAVAPSRWPPWWLIAATTAGFLLIAGDWRRTRRAAT